MMGQEDAGGGKLLVDRDRSSQHAFARDKGEKS